MRNRIKCEYCKKAFVPYRSSVKYCSDRCRGAALRERKRQSDMVNRPENYSVKRMTECPACGEAFVASSGIVKYCESCRKLSYDRRAKLRRDRINAENLRYSALDISEICAKAREAGMSYGKYVQANGL